MIPFQQEPQNKNHILQIQVYLLRPTHGKNDPDMPSTFYMKRKV